MHLILSMLFTLFHVLQVYPQQSWYTITSFTSDVRSFPVSGSPVAAPLSGDTLKQIKGIPELNEGDIVLRRRFGPSEYGLYLGRKDASTFTSLYAFKPPPDMPTNMFINRKLYLQETDNPNMDIANVYFDNDYIYVENAAKILFFEQGWNVLEMRVQNFGFLTITSYPESASVFIDGIKRGKTPLCIEELFNPFSVATVKIPGYYIQDFFINMEGGKDITKHFILSKMPPPLKGTYINPDTYTSENVESVEALDNQIEKLKERIRIQKEINANSLVQFEKKFPTFPEQGEFEKTADFLQRKELYLQRKKTGKMEVALKGNPKVLKLEESLSHLTRYRTEIENRIYHRYLPSHGIHLNRYEPDLEYFPIDVSVNGRGHNFAFSGILRIPLCRAPDFKQSIEKSRLKLSYRNRIFKQGNPKTKILYEYTTLSVLFKGCEYVLEGKCRFPDKMLEKDLEGSIASLPEGTIKKPEGGI